MHVPQSTQLTPTNTGWYAGFSSLESSSDTQVGFADDAQRFAGATFDPSGIYRFNAVMDLFAKCELTADRIHSYVLGLQKYFLEQLGLFNHRQLNNHSLIDALDCVRGHFLAFELDSEQDAKDLARQLLDRKVVVDTRARRIRFGFGLYQDEQDIDDLLSRLA